MASETPAYDKLRWRLKKFVDAFIETGIGAEAMRRAGFKGTRPDCAANKLRKKPKIRQAIAEREALAVKAAGRSAAEVLHVIWDTVDRCRQVVPVLDREGKPVTVETPDGQMAPAYVFDTKAVLKGAELLGKYHKLFTDKVEHLGPGGGPIQTQTQVVIFPDGGPGESTGEIVVEDSDDTAAGTPSPETT